MYTERKDRARWREREAEECVCEIPERRFCFAILLTLMYTHAH